ICHRNRRGRMVDLPCPKLFAGSFIECPEARVGGCSHENQTACSSNWSAAGCRTGVALAFRERWRCTEGNLPGYVTGVRIDCNQAGPWRLLTGPISDRLAVLILHYRAQTYSWRRKTIVRKI